MTAAFLVALLLGSEAPVSVEAAQIPGYVRVRPDLASSGAPTPDGFAALRALGFRTVISLLREDEDGAAGEKALVEAQGLRFVSIPVSAASLSREDGEAVAKVLADAEAGPVLLHCVSGNRSGGLVALLEASKGVPIDDAIGEGKKAGLKSESMIDAVRRVAGGASSGKQ